mmetsp:Transcript_88618/g.271269  ORF Transcript_88618/g.271269 Transcript_88618/m.271269 type:complete len:239 (+) Transcript_88618:362-1078(+)
MHLVRVANGRVVKRDGASAVLHAEAQRHLAVLQQDGAIVTLHHHLDLLRLLAAGVGEAPRGYGLRVQAVAREHVALAACRAVRRLPPLDPEGRAVRAGAVHLAMQKHAKGRRARARHAEFQQVSVQLPAPQPIHGRVALQRAIPCAHDLNIVQAISWRLRHWHRPPPHPPRPCPRAPRRGAGAATPTRPWCATAWRWTRRTRAPRWTGCARCSSASRRSRASTARGPRSGAVCSRQAD